jgi:hypothetical protein
MAIFSNKKGIRDAKGTRTPPKRTRVPVPGLKWAPPKRGEGPPPYVPEGKRPVPKRTVPKSRLGRKLRQRLRKLLKKRGRKGKPGRGKIHLERRRRRRPGQRSEGIGHAAIIDGKNWDGTRNNPRANARRERQRQRAARKPTRRGPPRRRDNRRITGRGKLPVIRRAAGDNTKELRATDPGGPNDRKNRGTYRG